MCCCDKSPEAKWSSALFRLKQHAEDGLSTGLCLQMRVTGFKGLHSLYSLFFGVDISVNSELNNCPDLFLNSSPVDTSSSVHPSPQRLSRLSNPRSSDSDAQQLVFEFSSIWPMW